MRRASAAPAAAYAAGHESRASSVESTADYRVSARRVTGQRTSDIAERRMTCSADAIRISTRLAKVRENRIFKLVEHKLRDLFHSHFQVRAQ